MGKKERNRERKQEKIFCFGLVCKERGEAGPCCALRPRSPCWPSVQCVVPVSRLDRPGPGNVYIKYLVIYNKPIYMPA